MSSSWYLGRGRARGRARGRGRVRGRVRGGVRGRVRGRVRVRVRSGVRGRRHRCEWVLMVTPGCQSEQFIGMSVRHLPPAIGVQSRRLNWLGLGFRVRV